MDTYELEARVKEVLEVAKRNRLDLIIYLMEMALEEIHRLRIEASKAE